MRTVFVHEFVTGGGLAGSALPPSWAAEGGAMRRALAEDFASLPGVRVVMTLDDRLPAEPGPWATVRVGPGRELATFGRLAAEADSTALIAPESGAALLQRARIIEEVGGRSLGSSRTSIRRTGLKRALYRGWRQFGIPTPPTNAIRPGSPIPPELTYLVMTRDAWDDASRLTDPLGAFSLDLVTYPYPAVLKPMDGAGCIDTYLLASPADAPPAGAIRSAWAVIQPFVPGMPMSASFLVDARGHAHLVGVARQRIEITAGRFSYHGGIVPAGAGAPLAEIRRAVDLVPGLLGWIGVDFLWDEARGRVTILELNPRPTTSYVGFRRLLPRGELAASWLDAAAGGDRAGALAGRIAGAAPVKFAADGTIPSRCESC